MRTVSSSRPGQKYFPSGFGPQERGRDLATVPPSRNRGGSGPGECTAEPQKGREKAASPGRLTPSYSWGDRGTSLERTPILSPTLRRVSKGARPVLGSRGKMREGSLKASTYRGYPSPGKESAVGRSRPAGKGSGSGPGRWEAADEPRRGANPATALNCTHLKWPPTTRERGGNKPL